MISLYSYKVTIRITLDDLISDKMFNEIEELVPDGKKLIKKKPIKDSSRYRHRYEFKTNRLDPFLRHLETYKVNNPDTNIYAEYERVFQIPYFLNIKDLLFPTRVTIRYTLDGETNPKEFKEYLQSSLLDEELPEAVDVGDENYKRFKINFKVSNTDTFENNFENFKNNRPNFDIYKEYEKTTPRSYFNVIIYLGTASYVVFRLLEFLGWLEPIQHIFK